MTNFTINEKTKKIVKICVCVITLLAIAVGGFIGGFFAHKETTKQYEIEAIVSEVIPDTSEVFFETTSGHIFFVVTDEIFSAYEKYTITFDTMGTPTVEDDVIVKVTRDISML